MKNLVPLGLIAILVNMIAMPSVNGESVKERLRRAQAEEDVTLSEEKKRQDEEQQRNGGNGYEDLTNCQTEFEAHDDEIKALSETIHTLKDQKKETLANLGYKRNNLNHRIDAIQKLTSDHLASDADVQRKKEVSSEAQKEISEFNSQIININAQLIAAEQEYDEKILLAKNKYNDLMKSICPNVKLPTYD